MTRPLAIDLFCGLGGWAEGLLAEGWDVVGFDIERHQYGEHRYPGQLVLQDVLTLHGSQFRDAAVIVASPPCQFFSYCAMPWSRARALAAEVRADPAQLEKELALFNACFRLQREASDAAGRRIPLIVENVKGAQKWVGRARWSYGSFYLWGDVPALMPVARGAIKVPGYRFDGCVERCTENNGGSWFAVAHNTASGKGQNPDGRKVASRVVHLRDGHAHTRHLTSPWEHEGVKVPGGGADSWFGKSYPSPMRRHSSSSPRRKMASALIAKIPLPLARHIAKTFRRAE